MPGGDTGATQVMPAAGGAPPPPPPTQPTLLMSHSRSSGSGGVPWWVWLIVALVVIAAAAAVLVPVPAARRHRPPPASEFIGNWAPEAGDRRRAGDLRRPATTSSRSPQYDGQLQAVGSTTADLVDDQLELSVQASALGMPGVTGKVQGTLTHEAPATVSAAVHSGDLQLEPVTSCAWRSCCRRAPHRPRALDLSLADPVAVPSASPSPSASASPTTDQQVIDGIAKLQVGIVTWASEQQQPLSAAPGRRRRRRHLPVRRPWPTNPFTGQPMTPGTAPGSYVYEQLSGGQGYKLTGYLSNGLTYTVP